MTVEIVRPETEDPMLGNRCEKKTQYLATISGEFLFIFFIIYFKLTLH